MTDFDWPLAIMLAIATTAVVALAMPPLIGWLRRRAVWDRPNARSSHSEPTPRGGGIAVCGGILLSALIWLGFHPDPLHAIMLGGMTALAVVSWLDDRHGGLPAGLRLAMHGFAIGAVIAILPADLRIAPDWIPLWLERLICFFAWLWFTNLFNFMDGINGITGGEMAAIGAGLLLMQVFGAGLGSTAALGAIMAAAAAGFLPWNWNRAKVFLGDVGSVPLGYLIGWLLLDAALHGQWAAALILPMYYWVDATVTLLRRLWRREKIWQAHRSHFYQQGARRLGSHVAVTTRLLMLNLFLAGMAVASLQSGMMALAATGLAAAAAAGLCRHFAMPANPVE